VRTRYKQQQANFTLMGVLYILLFRIGNSFQATQTAECVHKEWIDTPILPSDLKESVRWG
jgi:hypothetical protein